MIVPERGKRTSVEEDGARRSLAHRADAGQGNPFKRGGDRTPRREQELVILAAVERLLQRSAGKTRRGSDFGHHPGRLREALKIERESVREIHGARGAIAEKLAECEPWLGADVPLPGRATAAREPARGAAETPRDVDPIAGASAVPAKRFPARHRAAHDDVAGQFVRMPEVAADQRGARAAG